MYHILIRILALLLLPSDVFLFLCWGGRITQKHVVKQARVGVSAAHTYELKIESEIYKQDLYF